MNHSFVSCFTNLTTINISGSQSIGQSFITEMSSLVKLRKMELRGIKMLSTSLSIFTSLTNITHLDLTRCPRLITDSLEYLSLLTNMTFLSISGCDQLSGNCFSHLTHLTNLLSLDVGSCRMSAGISYISSFSNLTYLSLWKNKVTNDILKTLSRLTSLTYLDLGDTLISASGLPNIISFKNLKFLDVRQTQVQLDKALEILNTLRIQELLVDEVK